VFQFAQKLKICRPIERLVKFTLMVATTKLWCEKQAKQKILQHFVAKREGK
jgi:hypothetical protein